MVNCSASHDCCVVFNCIHCILWMAFFYLVYLIITHFCCFLVMSYSFILLLLFFHYSVLLVALSVVVFFNLLFSLHWCWFCLLFFVTFLGWLYYFMVGFVQNAFHCLLFPCCSWLSHCGDFYHFISIVFPFVIVSNTVISVVVLISLLIIKLMIVLVSVLLLFSVVSSYHTANYRYYCQRHKKSNCPFNIIITTRTRTIAKWTPHKRET